MIRNRNLWSRRREPVDREELVRLLPSPGDPVLPPGRRTLLEEHLMSEIDRETAAGAMSEPERRPRTRPRPGRRLALLATPVAVAAIAAGGFALVGQSTSTGGTDDPAGRRPPSSSRPLTLELAAQRIAQAAAGEDVPAPGPDQFVYIKTLNSYIDEELGYEPQPPSRREDWMSPDGWEGMYVAHEGDGECARLGERWNGESFVDEDGDVTVHLGEVPDCDEAVDPDDGQPNPEEPSHGSYDWLAALPTDPDALLERLYQETEGQSSGPDQAVFEEIRELAGELMPPDLAAAMYQAAADIPGVVLVDEAVDLTGREGIAIARTDEERGERVELIFDAETFEYLGERGVMERDTRHIEAGTVTGGSAVLQRGVVDEMQDRPADSTT
jgi:hypothetical protein